MKKIVIIGANDFQNQLILKAKSLKYETHVFAWRDDAVGEKNADFFYPISIIEKDKILEKCREIKPVGVCSIGSDLASITVNYVAEKLGLPCNPTSILLQCTNKYKMRETLMRGGMETPKFTKVASGEKANIDGFHFPLIVKPTDRSGSRGVTKIFNVDELSEAIENAIKSSFDRQAIVEEFIGGDEYSCECISHNKEHHFLAFTKKYTTGPPSFIETAHYEPSDINQDKQDFVKQRVFKALSVLGIENGASHTEFKLDRMGNFHIIEVGARMGGDCIGSDLVYLSTGYDFVKMVIDVACGNNLDFTIHNHYKGAGIKFILTQQDLDEMTAFAKQNPTKIHRISEMNIDNFNNISDSSNRVGYYIYKEQN